MPLDFLDWTLRNKGRDSIQLVPTFNIIKSKDLMTRGGDFYAIWDEEKKLWCTDEQDAVRIIDNETMKYKANSTYGDNVSVALMKKGDTGIIDNFHKYVRYQLRDNFHPLDESLIFANQETKKEDYASKKLPYDMAVGEPVAWNTILATLYSPTEAHKIQWSIGCILSGDSKRIQKFVVFYGNRGTGKSTVLNVIEKLFVGYYTTFDAKSLGQMSNAFALEPFKNNPLVAIQHDGDLSRIEDNTRLNSLVSHELMMVNEKFKTQYPARFKTFLYMGTNRPVKITDGKSGLLRRLIDISPTGNTIPRREYDKLVAQLDFELGFIANQCLQVYLDDPGAYNDYVPTKMLDASNDFFNFIDEYYFTFKRDDGTILKTAWEMYKQYCEEAKIQYPFSLRVFKEELKNYFYEFREYDVLETGQKVRNRYVGFKSGDERVSTDISPVLDIPNWLDFKEQDSAFDELCANCYAQYASPAETPSKPWDDVTTTLKDIDTKKLHYVKPQLHHIVIDFDLKDDNGKKSLKKNIDAASKFPPTYAEISKSGNGIHLHYIYSGEPTMLENVYKPNIEIKVFNKKSSLRRMLTKCNSLGINEISSGLPIKEVKNKVINNDRITDVGKLQNTILKAMRKEIHPDTTSNINFINKLLNDAYEGNISYDLTNLRSALTQFASNSTNQAQYCMKVVRNMKLRSRDFEVGNNDDTTDDYEKPIAFFDVEVTKNLILIVWKVRGETRCYRIYNPSPIQMQELFNTYRMIGYNNRKYDNHICYAVILGYDNLMVYQVSKAIISNDPASNPYFPDAWNKSYADVYDMLTKKQGLKKYQIEYHSVHKEMDIDWDKELPQNRWEELGDYCENDVRSTELVFENNIADYDCRRILAKLSGKRVNDTTNTHTEHMIFGKNRNPQKEFNYRFMGIPEDKVGPNQKVPSLACDWFYTVFDDDDKPLFPGYTFENGESRYRGEVIGEGGYVYAEPGIYYNVALLDIASMHPSSIVAENLFGDTYTKHFKELMDIRLAIKHKDFDKAKSMFNGMLAEYLTDEKSAKKLSNALKIAINSVYGLTAAKFDNPFRDIRNVDNIVAKRGALFMVNLKHEVQSRGFTVAHIKTDSIKIPNATPEIIKFVMDYGKLYGYNFEHEATYRKMCLINDAVYIAQYNDGHWEATGKQFQVPYVFKTLFSHEPIDFYDMCETNNCNTLFYLDANENLPNAVGDTNYSDKSKHNLCFVGRVGQFTPVKDGFGGGSILRKNSTDPDDYGYSFASGSKGYKWLESYDTKVLFDKGEDVIDVSYYDTLVEKAKQAIAKYGDVNEFLYG